MQFKTLYPRSYEKYILPCFHFCKFLETLLKSTLKVYESILRGQNCSEKRKYAMNLSFLFAVYFASGQIVEMC